MFTLISSLLRGLFSIVEIAGIIIVSVILAIFMSICDSYGATYATYGDDYVTIEINNTLSFTLCEGEWRDYVTWEINLPGDTNTWTDTENISVRSFSSDGLCMDYQMAFDRGHFDIRNGRVYGTFTREEFISLLSWLNNSAGRDTNIALYGDFHREHVTIPAMKNSRNVSNEVVRTIQKFHNFNF